MNATAMPGGILLRVIRSAPLALSLLCACAADGPLPPNHVESQNGDQVLVVAPELGLAVGDHVVIARSYCYTGRRATARCTDEGLAEGVVTALLFDHRAYLRIVRGGEIERGDLVKSIVATPSPR